MAAITTSGGIANTPGISSGEAIPTPFGEHRQELTWLAEFLTGDTLMASACLIDAGTLIAGENDEHQEWLWPWPREATIRSALDVQRARIAQLSSLYDCCDCVYGEHAGLPLEMLEFLIRESDVIRARLDTICRFVLILCGIGNRRSREVALLLGISEHAVEAAYRTSLQCLDVIRSQAIVEAYGYAAACN
jgi:hypothetical protein